MSVLVSRRGAEQDRHYRWCTANDEPYMVMEKGRLWTRVHWDMYAVRSGLTLNEAGCARVVLFLRQEWDHLDRVGRRRRLRKRVIFCGSESAGTMWLLTDEEPVAIAQQLFEIIANPHYWRAEGEQEWIALRRRQTVRS